MGDTPRKRLIASFHSRRSLAVLLLGVIEEHQKRWDALEEKELLNELDVSRWYLNDFRNSYKVLEDCKKITCPTLIITGETDPVAPPADARAIHAAIPGS